MNPADLHTPTALYFTAERALHHTATVPTDLANALAATLTDGDTRDRILLADNDPDTVARVLEAALYTCTVPGAGGRGDLHLTTLAARWFAGLLPDTTPLTGKTGHALSDLVVRCAAAGMHGPTVRASLRTMTTAA